MLSQRYDSTDLDVQQKENVPDYSKKQIVILHKTHGAFIDNNYKEKVI